MRNHTGRSTVAHDRSPKRNIRRNICIRSAGREPIDPSELTAPSARDPRKAYFIRVAGRTKITFDSFNWRIYREDGQERVRKKRTKRKKTSKNIEKETGIEASSERAENRIGKKLCPSLHVIRSDSRRRSSPRLSLSPGARLRLYPFCMRSPNEPANARPTEPRRATQKTNGVRKFNSL